MQARQGLLIGTKWITKQRGELTSRQLQPKRTMRLIPQVHYPLAPSPTAPSNLENCQRPPCKAPGSLPLQALCVFSLVVKFLLKNWINQGFAKIMFKINQCLFQYILREKPRSHHSPTTPACQESVQRRRKASPACKP